MIIKKLIAAIFLLSFVIDLVWAEVRLPKVFGDNMVLQQGKNITLRGWADPGEQIKGSLGSQHAETVTDASGTWNITFDSLDAGGPFELVLTGKNTISVKNILVGEVWVCSGQSNMEMPVGNVEKWYSGVLNYESEIAAANYPQIRLFKEGRIVADMPQDDCKGSWTPCNPDSIVNFSAVAYFFGRKLYQELGVPIGIIDASNGGTDISAWMSKEVLNSDTDFKPILDDFHQMIASYPQAYQVYQKRMAKHRKEVDEAKAAGKPVPWREPMPPAGPGDRNTPSGLYNGMIAPLMHSRIAGVIWYQGENNTGNAHLYEKLFPAMIKDWRHCWRQGDFPFFYVQLAGFNNNQTWWSGSGENWVRLRNAQLKTLSVPNTGMAVAADIGDENDTHMKNKQEVGRRLALWALAKTYSKSIVYSGPVYKSMVINGNKIILHFDYIGSGLISSDGTKLKSFLISGPDEKFINADAIILGDAVVVSSGEVANPVAVRYAWKDFPQCSLYNKENLPASPFRTDDW